MIVKHRRRSQTRPRRSGVGIAPGESFDFNLDDWSFKDAPVLPEITLNSSDWFPDSRGGGDGFDWGSLVSQISGGGMKILGARYGVPPEGTFIRNADGSVISRPVAGQASGYETGSSSWLPLVLLGVGGLVLVMAISKGRGE